jgi:hypothetical protein
MIDEVFPWPRIYNLVERTEGGKDLYRWSYVYVTGDMEDTWSALGANYIGEYYEAPDLMVSDQQIPLYGIERVVDAYTGRAALAFIYPNSGTLAYQTMKAGRITYPDDPLVPKLVELMEKEVKRARAKAEKELSKSLREQRTLAREQRRNDAMAPEEYQRWWDHHDSIIEQADEFLDRLDLADELDRFSLYWRWEKFVEDDL